MSAFDISIVVAAALTGWFVVSWLFNRTKPKDSPLADGPPAQASTGTTDRALSVAEVGEQWHRILGVGQDSAMERIEARFHEAAADCDRIRFSALSSPSEIAAAESRRRAVMQAYEFIRSARAVG